MTSMMVHFSTLIFQVELFAASDIVYDIIQGAYFFTVFSQPLPLSSFGSCVGLYLGLLQNS